MTRLRNTLRKIPEVDNFLGDCFYSSDLGLAGTEGGILLALAEPSDGAPAFEDDFPFHATDFEQCKECTFGN